MLLKMRGTVSTLCAKTSGREPNTSASCPGSALKSGASSSTPVSGFTRVDLADGLGVEPRAAVGKVVASHAGDGGVAQPHGLHGGGDPARLVPVEGRRLAGVDLAEVAAAGALVAADEEGRLAVLPALVDVGTAGLLADGVQTLALHQRLQLGELRPHPRPRLDPLRLALDRGLARCAPRCVTAAGRQSRWRAGVKSPVEPTPGERAQTVAKIARVPR